MALGLNNPRRLPLNKETKPNNCVQTNDYYWTEILETIWLCINYKY